jgi:hypothetical protein
MWTTHTIADYFAAEGKRMGLTTRQLGHTQQYVRNLIRDGRLPGFRVGRDLVAFEHDVVEFACRQSEERSHG